MTWPTIFANLSAGNQPLSLFDTMFNQVAQMVAIPCTATGTNAISLSPIGTAPALANYQNFSSFRFIAAATSTGLVTAQYQALGFFNVYLSDGATQVTTNQIVINQEYVLVFAQFLNGGAGGFFLESAALSTGVVNFSPNAQIFLTGVAQTYTTPTAGGRLPLYLRVRILAGGGGGGAQATNAGTAGSDTTWVTGGGTWQAVHGNGGPVGGAGANGGAGGTGGTSGTGTLVRRLNGSRGGPAQAAIARGNCFGGGTAIGPGTPSSFSNNTANNAIPNSGAGGAGGFTDGAGQGGGGGGGEFAEFIIATPAPTYTYTVGTAGNGGAAGTTAGGNGADGRIEVEAFWQ